MSTMSEQVAEVARGMKIPPSNGIRYLRFRDRFGAPGKRQFASFGGYAP